jgi:multimeric flavodoxin WrbA
MSKVLALFAGNNGKYSEYLAKTALKGAKDAGAEVEIVNITKLNLKPCIGCQSCVMAQGPDGEFTNASAGYCVIKDDFQWLDEKLMESDAMIVCMPIYEKSPPGEFKILMDRTGPSHDVIWRKHAWEERKKKAFPDGKQVDERSFKRRPVMFIAHGGTEWGSLALPMMELWTIPMGFQLVDMKYIPWNLKVYFDDKTLGELYRSGKVVAESAGKDAVPYIGPKGICPVCHSSTVNIKEGSNAECSVCSAYGTLETKDGQLTLVLSEEGKTASHYYDSGREKHYQDICGFGEVIFSMDFEELEKRQDATYNWIKVSKPEK